jgi:hypothetical protein
MKLQRKIFLHFCFMFFIYFVVIDEQQKESLPEHETQLSSIRWHISEGLYKAFCLFISR